MNGYGEWVQLSVFQCRLSRRRRVELKLALGEIIDHAEDHVVILDLGPPRASGRGWKASASPSPWSNAARLSCRMSRRHAASGLATPLSPAALAALFDIVEQLLAASFGERRSGTDRERPIANPAPLAIRCRTSYNDWAFGRC